jgi:hypothetical protein
MESSLKYEVIDILSKLSEEQRGWALREPIYRWNSLNPIENS